MQGRAGVFWIIDLSYKKQGRGVLLPTVGGVAAVTHIFKGGLLFCLYCKCLAAKAAALYKPGAWGLAPTFLFGSFSLPASRACMCVAHYPFGMGSALQTYTFGRVWRWP